MRVGLFLQQHYRQRYRPVFRHARQLFIFDLVLLAAALALGGATLYFLIWKPNPADKIQLTLELAGGRIRSGDLINFTVNYQNQNQTTIRDARLRLMMPASFIAAATADQEINLGDLAPQAKASLDFSGRLWATPGLTERLTAIISFSPDKNTAERVQKTSSVEVKLPASALTATLDIASATFGGVALPFTVTLTNNTDAVSPPLQLLVTPRQETLIAATTFAPLPPGQPKTITGAYSPARGPAANIPLTLTTQVITKGTAVTQNILSPSLKRLAPAVSLTIQVKERPPRAEAAGELPLEVSWKNLSPYRLLKSRLLLAFSPPLVDLKTTAINNRLPTENNKLLFTAEERTVLQQVKPGGSDQFTIPLQLLSTFSALNLTTATFTITPVLQATLAEVPQETFVATGTPLAIPILTELKLSPEVRYYTDEGDQLGRGPLPPRVGKTTKYWIMARLANTVSPVSEVKFQAALAPSVTFTGRQSVTLGAPFTYDTATRVVSWQHPELPPQSITGLYFEVALTPTPEMAGKAPTLVETIRIRGSDAVVKQELQQEFPALTNELPPADRGRRASPLVNL